MYPVFERLPLLPTNHWTSQWFGATDFAYTDGADWNYDGYCQGFHCGIDIGREPEEYGDPVVAGVYGVVESTWDQYGAGPYAVNIRIGNYRVLIGHLDEDILVEVGDYVTPDTIVGGVGNPYGDSTKGNVHIHLEIFRIDPTDQSRLVFNPLLFMDDALFVELSNVIVSDYKQYR